MKLPGARWIIWFTAFVNTGLCSGIIFGWPSFVLILKDEGLYRDSSCPADVDETCDSQELKLNIIFTVGFAALIGSRLVAGTFLDVMGPKHSAVLGGTLCTLGSLLVAVSEENVFDAFAVGFFMIGCGGSLVHLANFHISNLFPKIRRTIVSTYSAVFSVSGAVLVVVQLLYEFVWASRQGLMLMYMCMMIVVTLSSHVIHSRRPYPLGCQPEFNWCWVAFQPPPAPKDKAAEVEAGGATEDEGKAETASVMEEAQYVQEDGEEVMSSKPPIAPRVSQEPYTLKLPLIKQIFSLPFFTILIVFSTVLLQLQFFVATAQLQLERKGDTKSATNYAYSRTFTVMNALTSPLFIPVVGYILDKRGFSTAFTVVFALATAHNVIAAYVPWLEVQPLSFLCLTLSRFLVFASLFAWCIHFFGFKSFGKTAGLLSTIASIINLSQYGFTALTVEVFNGDFVYVNTLWIILLQPLYIVPFIMSKPGQMLVKSGRRTLQRCFNSMERSSQGKTPDEAVVEMEDVK